MFKNSEESKAPDLFKGVTQHLSGVKLRDLEDENAWQNQFYSEITSRIAEDVFAPLYSTGQGRPNASIRQLVAMILLKEGHDWTDEQLFENSRYNLKVMRALGLTNIDDSVPSESTYYDFKGKLVLHFEETQRDLFEEMFSRLTTEQVMRYKIKGREVRLDSKLIQSNIRNFTRLQKLIQVIQVFHKSLGEGHGTRLKKKGDREFLESILSQKPEQHTYGMSNRKKDDWLERIGFLMRKLTNLYSAKDSEYYDVLCRSLKEQYDYDDGSDEPPQPRKPEDIPPKSLQSVHDQEATYRRKGHGSDVQKINGYSANITEVCGDEELHLITDVQVECSTTSDDSYLVSAIKNTEDITGVNVEEVWTDGGYDSIENRKQFGEWQDKTWHLSKIKGSHSYDFAQGEGGEILVTDLITNEVHKAHITKAGKYRIPSNRGTSDYRYFSKDTVETRLILNNALPRSQTTNKRANVESTIHQVFYTLKGRKSKYRGWARNRLYVFARSAWVNFRRIRVKALNDLSKLFSANLLELLECRLTLAFHFFRHPIKL